MASLVQFLAAGVNGAESGTATFLLRGTASSAASVLYNDFEETSQPGTNVIALDANGGAEIYCDAYCDVQLATSAGNPLRTVTIGHAATMVEVESSSFEGTDYDGSPANTAGQPVTLAEVLDRWLASAGATNWEVDVNGVATDIQSAIAGLAGMFVNVKDPTYGALGDGVTNDTAAILAACAAVESAGGGIVFFPPGTYPCGFLNPTVPNVVLMGCGPEASVIRATSAGTALLRFLDNTSNTTKRITGLGFSAGVARASLLDVEESQVIAVDNCKFDCTDVSDAAIRRLDVDGDTFVNVLNCDFVNVAGDSAFQNLADDGESYLVMSGCRLALAAGFTGAAIVGPDFSVSQCQFDGSAITSGTYYHVNAESNETAGKYIGSFTGNRFLDGASDGYAFDLQGITSGSVFRETGNVFSGFVDPASPSESGHIYRNTANSGTLLACEVELGSRIGRVLRFADATSIVNLSADLVAEIVIIEHSVAGNFQINLNENNKPPGTRSIVVTKNASGDTRDVIFNGLVGSAKTVSGVTNGSYATLFTINSIESVGQEALLPIATNRSNN